VAASDPLYAQPFDAQPSDAQSSDAQPSDGQTASCQPQRPSFRLREPFPCLHSPDLVHAPSPKHNSPKRAPPTAPPGTLPAPTAPTLHLSSTILRKVSRSKTEEEDLEYIYNFPNYLWLFCTRMPLNRRQDLL
jgi:hypothetical protein